MQDAIEQACDWHCATPLRMLQAMPQPPQFCVDDEGSTQVERQQANPFWQLFPQAPQLATSAVSSAHLLLQQLRPPAQPWLALHPGTHWSLLQT